jgi:hypothetical protein
LEELSFGMKLEASIKSIGAFRSMNVSEISYVLLFKKFLAIYAQNLEDETNLGA